MWNMKKMWSLIWKQNIKLCVFSLILPPKIEIKMISCVSTSALCSRDCLLSDEIAKSSFKTVYCHRFGFGKIRFFGFFGFWGIRRMKVQPEEGSASPSSTCSLSMVFDPEHPRMRMYYMGISFLIFYTLFMEFEYRNLELQYKGQN